MKQELKPCHCGAEANLMYDDSTQVEMCYIECSKCLMATMQDTYENVIKDWNTRPYYNGKSIKMVKTLTTEIDWGQRVHELQIALINQGVTNLHEIDSKVESLIDYQCIKSGDERFNQLKQQSDEK